MDKPERRKGRRLFRAVLRWLVIALAAVFAVLFILNYLGVRFPWSPKREGVSFTFIDVGQGDAALIMTETTAIAVDVGPTDSGEKTADRIFALAGKLDCIVITHPHEDHMGALSEVLETVPTDRVLMNADASDASYFTRALDFLEKNDVPVDEAKAGDVIEIGDITLEIFAPTAYTDDKNSNCVVLRASTGGVSVDRRYIVRRGQRLRPPALLDADAPRRRRSRGLPDRQKRHGHGLRRGRQTQSQNTGLKKSPSGLFSN